MPEPTTTIPKGSLVLVTGITGFVGSHTAKQFLERGYRVRGTVRDVAKASWLVDGLFKKYTASGDLEIVAVADLGAKNAFDEAVKGVVAICHVASIVTFDTDPHKVIPQTVAGTVSILAAAAKEHSVKSFVYTSSIVATAIPMPGIKVHVDRDTWNTAAVEMAWSTDSSNPPTGPIVYMASKVEAEKEVWKFVKNGLPFTVNSVNPSKIIGEPFDVKHSDHHAVWIAAAYFGDVEKMKASPGLMAVDVKDVALLHVAAVLDPDIKNARLPAWGHNGSWNDVLAILRKIRPNKKFPDDFPDSTVLDLSTDETQVLGLLKKWGGQDGWRSLESTVEDNLKLWK